VKENQEKDKIRSKPDKNGKRVEAEKSLKQLQWERKLANESTRICQLGFLGDSTWEVGKRGCGLLGLREATPLARKVTVVDYQIIQVNNKPRYKIIKADETHQLYASFITMLKNFDRDDLETLWRIVKERLVKDLSVVNDATEGFVEVKKKKHKNKNKQHKVAGLRLPKPQPQLVYRRVERGETFQKVHTDKVPIVTQATDDSKVDEEFQVDHNGNDSLNRTGASTPVNESHVTNTNLTRLCFGVFNHWDWTLNGSWCNKGTRIIMGWNHNDVDVVVIDQDDQVIHTRILVEEGEKGLFYSFIYAHNRYTHRRSLWRSLSKHNIYIRHRPWSIMGDFNVSLYLEESTACSSNVDVAMRDFRDYVEDIEMLDDHYISGFFMFRVVKKLKNLKNPLRKLLYDKGNVHANVNKLRTDIDAIQTALDADPFNVVLRKRKATCVIEFNEVEGETSNFNYANLFNPGPDDFTATFFKEAWNIIANDVYLAVSEFFRNDTLLKEINHTIIALLPKVKSPYRVNDYRPISCCNVLFKCISKIIANRIKHSLKMIISPNQSAFILGWSITDNILLTQELVHNYHLERGTTRCDFKFDIQMAYDTVDWDFLRIILLGFSFHQKMVSWIMECVTSTSYSICVNDSFHGYFMGKRGLRQGDLTSPYLFSLVMDVLTLMLQRKVHQTDQFTYHRYCSKMELVNICFADDLFLFAYGDVGSASIIKEALDEFKNASVLVPILPKSTTYFCNVLNHVMRQFLWSLGSSGKRNFRLVKFGMIFIIVTLRKLKMHDLVPMWDVSDSLGMVCSFCESVPDSHDHLFFECPFAKGI
nr:hypothetical protein [Tanacetum cinerariifolium]